MQKIVAIDYLPESAPRYGAGWAVVAVDVIRATTTAVTAAAAGWRCFPAPTIDAARAIARGLDDPVLAGESGGDTPAGFEMDNSPAQLARRTDTYRPLVMVSSSGTKLIHAADGCDALYLSCFRTYSALPAYLAASHPQVAIIGAGTKGEFREEDQAGCAWIASRLMKYGYQPADARTAVLAARWRDRRPEDCLSSRSVAFLKRTGRIDDLNFIFSHIDDLHRIFTVQNGEVFMTRPDSITPAPADQFACLMPSR